MSLIFQCSIFLIIKIIDPFSIKSKENYLVVSKRHSGFQFLTTPNSFN